MLLVSLVLTMHGSVYADEKSPPPPPPPPPQELVSGDEKPAETPEAPVSTVLNVRSPVIMRNFESPKLLKELSRLIVLGLVDCLGLSWGWLLTFDSDEKVGRLS